jgi:ABC-type antimicrobial peptide transport system permease subunit
VSSLVVIGGLVALAVTSPGWATVRDTFFSWSAFKDSFPDVAKAFWLDIKMFCVIEVAVLIVGMVITAQTLYSATAANAKEFAILLALGIPRWRIYHMVLTQSFWVGIIGIGLAYPICVGLRALAGSGGAPASAGNCAA